MLNQTLTTAYQELRTEMDSLQAEKAQEQYYASMAAQQAGSSSYDASQQAGYGQEQGDPSLWAYDSNWVPEEWDDGGAGGSGGQQY